MINNTIRTVFLLMFLAVLFILVGGAFGGTVGLIIGVVLALIMNFGAYWFSDKIELNMINEYKPKLAWILFTGSILSSLIFDYILRLYATDFYTGGLNKHIWFGFHVIGFLGLILFTGKIQANFLYLRKLSKHLILASLFYLFSVYGYVLGLGLDSF